MAYILNHEGKPYLKIFEDIARIPHGSFNEQAISDYIVEFAEKRKLWCVRDEANNVFIKIPATPGYEDHMPVILQGHMDMVCEKAPASNHDFMKDPLELYVEDGWLKAQNTTLGGDNGVSVAYILALLDEEGLEHPALECILNTAEEPGIFGAKAFDTSQLTGKKFIGLDGCTEGTSTILTTGVSAGSFFRKATWEDSVKETYKVQVFGLNAGHAAGNIGKEQLNALKAIGRVLHYANKNYEIGIAEIKGGTIRNAIAEECEAVISIAAIDAQKLKECCEGVLIQLKEEHALSDPGMQFTFEKVSGYEKVLSKDVADDIINFLYLMPTGVYMRSLVYDWLPVSSRNMGTIGIVNRDGYEAVEISYMFRCVKTSQLSDLCENGILMASLWNFEFNEETRYSGYEIKPGKELYNIYAEVYKEMSGKDLVFEAVHYGTDAGTYAERIEDLDIIVISPILEDVHRPTERLNLDSFHRAYQYLKEVLRRC